LNYRAHLFVNGQLARSSSELVGAYRRFDVLLDDHLSPARNCLALEVFPPQVDDHLGGLQSFSAR
jgi:hypothetical protein